MRESKIALPALGGLIGAGVFALLHATGVMRSDDPDQALADKPAIVCPDSGLIPHECAPLTKDVDRDFVAFGRCYHMRSGLLYRDPEGSTRCPTLN
jgi:hypothetical protein